MWVRGLLLIICVTQINSETAALILARGGSKGVHLKNLKKVGVKSLLCRAIDTAKAAGLRDVTVSTDHLLIALEAIQCNATVFRRSHITATDTAPSIWGAAEFLAHRPDVIVLVLLQATSPFIQPVTVRSAVSKINHPHSFDCVFSVVRSYKLRWNVVDGTSRTLNFNVSARPRRQDWSGELLETGAFYIARRALIEKGYFQNNNCTVSEVTTSESFEVDTYYDLEVANILHKTFRKNFRQ